MDSPERAGTPRPSPLTPNARGFARKALPIIQLVRFCSLGNSPRRKRRGSRSGRDDWRIEQSQRCPVPCAGHLPNFKTDLANMFDRAASPRVR